MYNHMLVLVLIDHRWAFLLLAVLLMAAAIPLASAWARLLPEEPPPFPIEPGSFPTIDQQLPPETPSRRHRDLIISFALLVCITLTYLIRFPGFPSSALAPKVKPRAQRRYTWQCKRETNRSSPP